MKPLQIEAVYEQGALKLSRELPLQEGETVIITIHPKSSAAERMYGMLRWEGDPVELHRFLKDPS